MKHTVSKLRFVKTLLMIVMGVILFSQSASAGGDTYTIYLNKKLIGKQYVGQSSATLLSLPLENANPNDEITVYYSHCGVVGKGRNIVVKNEEGQVLKEWKFADGPDMSMTISVKDILDLKKKNADARLNLYYASSELMPKGMMLASINLGGKTTAWGGAVELPVLYASALLTIALYPAFGRKAS